MELFHIVTNAKTGETTQVAFTEAEVKEYNLKLASIAATEYQSFRAVEYPPITDYIDGIVKNDTEQVDAYIAACLAVKAKYPKP